MKLYSEIEQEVVYKKKRMIDGIQCDVCGVKILPTRYREDSSKYFKVTTGHNDWGNDSCESIEHKDICPACIHNFTREYLKEADGTEYLEVTTEHCWATDYEWF